MNQFNLLHDEFSWIPKSKHTISRFISITNEMANLFCVCASVLNKKLIYWKLIRINWHQLSLEEFKMHSTVYIEMCTTVI